MTQHKTAFLPHVMFRKSMMSGHPSEPVPGWLFWGGDEAFVAHRVGGRWRISHFATGYCVERAGDSSMIETIDGFRLALETGIKDMAKLKAGVATLPVLNRFPQGDEGEQV